MTKSKRAYHLDQRSRPSLTSGSPQPFRVPGTKLLPDTLTPSDVPQCAAGGGGRTDLHYIPFDTHEMWSPIQDYSK